MRLLVSIPLRQAKNSSGTFVVPNVITFQFLLGRLKTRPGLCSHRRAERVSIPLRQAKNLTPGALQAFDSMFQFLLGRLKTD